MKLNVSRWKEVQRDELYGNYALERNAAYVYRKCKSMTIKCKRDNNRYGLQMQGTRNIRTEVNEHLPH